MTHPKALTYALAAVVAVCSAGCSAVRECAPVEMTLPSGFTAGTDSASIADVAWWKFYSDSALTALIGRTLECNNDFLAAAANVEKCRQLYGAKTADLLPSVNATAYANRETNHYHGTPFSNDPEIGVKASLNWEVDLWGNLRWARKGSGAAYAASIEEWRSMRITLIAETAAAYFRLVALDNELDIVNRTIDTRAEELEKARLRYEGGLTSEIVYLQARLEYNTAKAMLPEIEKEIETTQNALAVLTGEFPGVRIVRNPRVLELVTHRAVPVGLPSSLLERRPDLRASAARLSKAMADVGVASTARFPQLTLTMTGGVENGEFANLFKSPFSYLAANLLGPVFDFGGRQKKYRASVAAYEEARHGYMQDVLNAFEETANAITAYTKAREATASKAALRDAALKYVDLAHLQYSGGTISYLDVLDAQRQYLSAETSHNNAVRDEMLALVTLYKSLGGGWALADLPTR